MIGKIRYVSSLIYTAQESNDYTAQLNIPHWINDSVVQMLFSFAMMQNALMAAHLLR